VSQEIYKCLDLSSDGSDYCSTVLPEIKKTISTFPYSFDSPMKTNPFKQKNPFADSNVRLKRLDEGVVKEEREAKRARTGDVTRN